MNSKVDGYITRQKSPQKEICESLRQLIHNTLPDTTEEMKWGAPAFSGGKFYIVALKDHVNIGFTIENLTDEELSLFDGGGKTTRHIQIKDPSGIDSERISSLIILVDSRS
ncbi:MAG: DUF1801 domain-containing protein [Dehalococcoidales bacterium]|nr:MAG: DUF1801 domain-containing protein [Dehalococcoidales bacterium]